MYGYIGAVLADKGRQVFTTGPAATIRQVAREMNEHDLAHLWQLRRTCDALAGASV